MENNQQITIYLSGPITGVIDWNQEAFYKADKYYRNCGYYVLNPHRIAKSMGDPSETEILREELTQLLQNADLMALLPGWENSKGALVEVATALAAGIPIIRAFSHSPLHPKLTIQADGSKGSKALAFDANKRAITPDAKRRKQEEQLRVFKHMPKVKTAP